MAGLNADPNVEKREGKIPFQLIQGTTRYESLQFKFMWCRILGL